jgi:superoxide dismutase
MHTRHTPQVMAPPGSPNASTSAISANLSAAIDASFGSFEAFKAGFSARAKALFGSGWAWLALSGQGGNASLALLTTANQDNPLMAPSLVRGPGCPQRQGPPPDAGTRLPGSSPRACAQLQQPTDRCRPAAAGGHPWQGHPHPWPRRLGALLLPEIQE